jgi:ABC-2 type transporter.
MFSFGLAVLLVAAAEVLYRHTLLAGLGVFGGPQAVWRRSAAKQPVVVAKQGAASPSRAIALKDWLSYRRDIRRLSRLLPAFLFPIGYALTFFRPSQINGFWTEVFLVAFISMFMSTALATPSIPSERRGFQLLRMAPMTMWQVIRAKVALTLPPVLALTLLFGIVVAAVSGSGIPELADRKSVV